MQEKNGPHYMQTQNITGRRINPAGSPRPAPPALPGQAGQTAKLGTQDATPSLPVSSCTSPAARSLPGARPDPLPSQTETQLGQKQTLTHDSLSLAATLLPAVAFLVCIFSRWPRARLVMPMAGGCQQALC